MRELWNDDKMYKIAVWVFIATMVAGTVTLSLIGWNVWQDGQQPCSVRMR